MVRLQILASDAGARVTQSPAALGAVRYGFTLIPAALMIVAILLQRQYTLDRTAMVSAAAASAPPRSG
ncbi:hypothetical protein [Paractinoplanes bogorensis]|uniref:hypothetical protein n=1 Tax=Paractinoplanes bogorensis TaxID=1610840 RepID=UPI001FE887CF|nr:hypothetical protein [Actinoplanes bogorensis]